MLTVVLVKQVKSALDDMFVAECPGEIQTMEGSNVFYYRDFESSQFKVNFYFDLSSFIRIKKR